MVIVLHRDKLDRKARLCVFQVSKPPHGGFKGTGITGDMVMDIRGSSAESDHLSSFSFHQPRNVRCNQRAVSVNGIRYGMSRNIIKYVGKIGTKHRLTAGYA